MKVGFITNMVKSKLRKYSTICYKQKFFTKMAEGHCIGRTYYLKVVEFLLSGLFHFSLFVPILGKLDLKKKTIKMTAGFLKNWN